ncbi:MAG: carbohydrate ABC transporter permease [Streptosporangiaceae bacterium]|nr:carbohydrate ABC transporter permease [Streptosporangiaceae bacterium]MBV9853689.1 carbohydrate ABC transporter permease [Streptosporangiaceae bacterium]
MRTLRYTVFYICLTLIAVVFAGPYVLAFFGALKPPADLYSSSPWTLPHSFYTGNFRTILFSDGFIRYLGNTALVTAVLTVGQVSFGVLAAYAFARLEFPGRDALFSVYLATLMVPNIVTIVPLYTMMRQFHLTNTYWAIFLPYVLGTPYTIFLMRQYFMSLPSEVFAAARVDGASEWRILTRLVIPMGRPIIITATLIAFVFGWNNFLWPLIVTDSNSRQVLTVSIAALQSSFSEQWNLVLAASLVALIPLLVVFALFQKQIVRSIQLSGVNR